MSLIIEHDFWNFLFMTVIIAGGAAFLAGRALATKWRPEWMAVAYMVPLAAALRFFHYALFNGSLLTLHYFLVDFIILVAAALLGYRLMRVKQMTGQYPWLYEKAGPFAWRERKGEAGR
jgi:GR25 family glycosyltransferase involved in LPS biosynthesis